jgi:hypothetical protein
MRSKYLRIGTLITLYIGWIAFYPIYLISLKLGLMNDPSFIRTMIICFLTLLIILSLMTILWITPIGTKLSQYLEKGFYKSLLIRKLISIVPGLLLLLLMVLIVVHPFSESFGVFRLFPPLIWSILFTLGIALDVNRSKLMDTILEFLGKKKFIWVTLCIIFYSFTIFFFLSPTNGYFQSLPQRITLFIIVSLLSADFYTFVFNNLSWWSLYASSSLIFAGALIIVYQATLISPYPFTIGWSEGKWMLDGSLIFSNKVYGFHAPIPFQEPTQALFRAFPFLFSNTPSLLFQRAWGFLLMVGVPIFTAFILVSKFIIVTPLKKLFLGILYFCLLFLGPIKFYLLFIYLVFLILYKSNNILRGALAVVVASLLIPPLQVNWFLLPGSLFFLFYIMETPYSGSIFRYFWKPFLLLLVSLLIVGTDTMLYLFFSGNPLNGLNMISSSPLLWQRLLFFPSEPLGVLIPILIMSIPSTWLIVSWGKQNRFSIHWKRQIVLFMILLIFFLGGLLVSAKIGGGNNLHNLDIYILLLSVVTFYVAINSIKGDRFIQPVNTRILNFMIMANAIFFSLWLVYMTPGSIIFPRQQTAVTAVQSLQNKIGQIQDINPKPALFIYQTQLLTSGLIQGVKPVPNHDNVFLMEMAISNNQSGLQAFYIQLEQHTWSVIVMPPLYTKIKDSSTVFAEENNAWVERIIFPMLCSYQSVYVDQNFDYELLIPREANHQCP